MKNRDATTARWDLRHMEIVGPWPYEVTVRFRVGANDPDHAIAVAAEALTQGYRDDPPETLAQRLRERYGACEISCHETGSGFTRRFGDFE